MTLEAVPGPGLDAERAPQSATTRILRTRDLVKIAAWCFLGITGTRGRAPAGPLRAVLRKQFEPGKSWHCFAHTYRTPTCRHNRDQVKICAKCARIACNHAASGGLLSGFHWAFTWHIRDPKLRSNLFHGHPLLPLLLLSLHTPPPSPRRCLKLRIDGGCLQQIEPRIGLTLSDS
jgi:hypothetical protein